MLRREQKIRNVILFTLFSILFIGVGYAVISSNLKMNGSMTLNKITWDVHLENFEELYDNTVHGTNTFSNENTNMTYTVSLNKPGDIYEFTIDVVNAGNIDAMLSALDVSGLDTAQQAVIEYSVKYLDGSTPTIKDALKVGESETFVITLKTKADITNDKLSATDTNLTLNFNPTYAQADKSEISRPTGLYSLIKKDAVLDNISSTYVSATTGIDFSSISSDTNGKGIYLLNTTKGDKNPVYYYRGAVENNNVKFGNYCWKIVRTTETGGIKLIYNGAPDASGYCSNTVGENTDLGTGAYNLPDKSLTTTGYMFGNKHIASYATFSNEYLYGSSVTYENGKYILQDAKTISTYEDINTNHYTCFNSTGECTEVAYIYFYSTTNSNIVYLLLDNGKDIENLQGEMNKNIYDSNAKSIVDNWYKDNMLSYSKNIRDEIWCNDRSIYTGANNGWNKNGGKVLTQLNFSAYERRKVTKSPSLQCTNENDRFTVKSSLGNESLKYPIALLTMDELMYAGSIDSSITNSENTSMYLHTNLEWWTMSPIYFYDDRSVGGQIYLCADGSICSYIVNRASVRIRPSISLKKGIKITSGDGTQNNPYVIS